MIYYIENKKIYIGKTNRHIYERINQIEYEFQDKEMELCIYDIKHDAIKEIEEDPMFQQFNCMSFQIYKSRVNDKVNELKELKKIRNEKILECHKTLLEMDTNKKLNRCKTIIEECPVCLGERIKGDKYFNCNHQLCCRCKNIGNIIICPLCRAKEK
jgi:hypothetical protein